MSEKKTPSRPAARDGGSSLTRMLGVLDLFTAERPLWATAEIINAIDISRSTGYRYLQALSAAGLVSPVGNGNFVLGPRVTELDLQIRKSDPLLRAAEGVLEGVVNVTQHSALLCTLFQNSVLCISARHVELSPTGLIDRGQTRPLIRGAMSRVILAYLPGHRLPAIFSRRGDEIAAANLGTDWHEFRNNLAAIRAAGYVKSIGEFTAGMAGIAAPVFGGNSDVIGSIGVACNADELQRTDVDRVATVLKRAGKRITERLAHDDAGLALQPRAIG